MATDELSVQELIVRAEHNDESEIKESWWHEELDAHVAFFCVRQVCVFALKPSLVITDDCQRSIKLGRHNRNFATNVLGQLTHHEIQKSLQDFSLYFHSFEIYIEFF
jgi:hypothetical protein